MKTIEKLDKILNERSSTFSREERVVNTSFKNGMKLVYGWIKDGTIDFKEFLYLVKEIRLS